MLEEQAGTFSYVPPASSRFRVLKRSSRFLVDKPLGGIGAIIIAVLLLMAIFAPQIAPFPYAENHISDRLQGPSLKYFFGTDASGRDIFSRIVYGARVSVVVGFGAVSISVLIAAVLGIVSAYYGGLVDTLIQRLVDIWLSFPSLVILISIMAVIGMGLPNLTLAIGLLLSVGFSRVVRASALTVKGNLFIEAATTIGASDMRIMFRHILPNVVPTIIVIATVQLGAAILIESSLSFLGYGVPPPRPSWGGMLSGSGLVYFTKAPWMAIFPGAFITLAVFGFNMLGDGLRDALDPRLRGSR